MPVFIQMDTPSERIGYTTRREPWLGNAGSRFYRRVKRRASTERGETIQFVGQRTGALAQLACVSLPEWRSGSTELARIIHERFCCLGPLQRRSNRRPDSPLPTGVLAALVRPPHRLGGAHRRGALYSSRRAPLDVRLQVRLGPSRLCLGVPIAGTPVAPFFMQRVEHAMGPTPGDCRVPVALPIMRARTGKDFPRDDAREHSLPMLRTPR